VDARELDDFIACHIKTAISYPASQINRDKLVPKVYYEFVASLLLLTRQRNQVDKIIILYCADERQGVLTAMTLHQKGYENIFLLNGGFSAF